MKKWYLVLATVSFVGFAVAQKPLPQLGIIDIGELKLQSCSFEPGADAMKLFDVQQVEYEHSAFGGKIITEKHVRIKIFNEKGYRAATINIPYYSNKRNTRISNLRGMVHNLDENGKIVSQSVEEADFFRQNPTTRVGMVNFTFPNLRPGSVIEYTYTITEKNRLQFDTWLVQGPIPVAYTASSLIIPSFSSLKFLINGSDTIQQKTESLPKHKEKRVFIKENVPSFNPEPYMSSMRDNLLHIGFILFPDKNVLLDNFKPASIWKMAANILLRSPFYNEQLEKVIPGTESIVDTALSILNVQDRVRYLYNVIKKRVPEKMEQTYFPQDIVDTWKTRSGSSAEINFLLLNLLRRAGVKCHPLLISTRENGKINTDFPNFGQFNGLDILVKDGERNYLIDASLKYQSYDIPPLNVLNRQAFLLDPDNLQWVTISDDRPLLKQSTDVFALLTDKGLVEGSASVKYFDYAKAYALDTMLTERQSERRVLEKTTPGLKILSDKKDIVETDEPLTQSLEFDFEPQLSEDFVYINPQFLLAKYTNPFKQQKRNYNIDFGCNQEHRLSLQLELPQSFQVEHLPKNMIIRSPDSSFLFTRMISADNSNIFFSQVIEIRRSLFDKEEYATIQEFYKNVFTVISEEIILKKKK